MKLFQQGEIVIGVNETYTRSQYEVIADDGFMLLLLQREIGGFINYDKTNLTIRPRDYFKLKINPTVLPSDDIEVFLPKNWYLNYQEITIKHNNNIGHVDVVIFS